MMLSKDSATFYNHKPDPRQPAVAFLSDGYIDTDRFTITWGFGQFSVPNLPVADSALLDLYVCVCAHACVLTSKYWDDNKIRIPSIISTNIFYGCCVSSNKIIPKHRQSTFINIHGVFLFLFLFCFNLMTKPIWTVSKRCSSVVWTAGTT